MIAAVVDIDARTWPARPVPSDPPVVAPVRRPRPVRSDPDTFDPMAAPAGYRPLFDRRPCGRSGPGTCCRDRALWDPESEGW